jgi:hypothetical protein
LTVEDRKPASSIGHVAGPSPNCGWRVSRWFESDEDAQRFVERLKPAFEAVGVPRPPQPPDSGPCRATWRRADRTTGLDRERFGVSSPTRSHRTRSSARAQSRLGPAHGIQRRSPTDARVGGASGRRRRSLGTRSGFPKRDRLGRILNRSALMREATARWTIRTCRARRSRFCRSSIRASSRSQVSCSDHQTAISRAGSS